MVEPDVGETAMEKSTPFPVSTTVITGYFVSFVLTVSVPVRVPVMVGVNTTEIVQVLKPVIVEPHVVLSE